MASFSFYTDAYLTKVNEIMTEQDSLNNILIVEIIAFLYWFYLTCDVV